MHKPLALSVLLTASLLLGGCPPEDFPNALDGVLTVDIDEIRNNTNLTPQEKRTELLALGLTPAAVNGVLRTERLGNQYGGTLRTAYDKVIAEQFSAMTPDEIQFYGDAARETAQTEIDTINDTVAQIIADLFDEEQLDSLADVQAFLDDPASDIPPDIPDDLLQELFIDFDPQNVIDQLP